MFITGANSGTFTLQSDPPKNAICEKHGLQQKVGFYLEDKLVGYFCQVCQYEKLIAGCPVITDDDGLLFEAAKEAWKKDE